MANPLQKATTSSAQPLPSATAGQDAVAAGVCAPPQFDDTSAGKHRGHGHCLAKGADVGRLTAEIIGRRTGYGRGRGGALHIFDAASGNRGTISIVGGGIPAGAALVRGDR